MNALTADSKSTLHHLNAQSDTLAKEARSSLQEFSHANNAQAGFELAVTLTGWLGLLGLSYQLVPTSPVLSLLCAGLGGLFWVRLFILQHDCGHGSFLSTPRLNRMVGGVLGVLTMTPFARWRASHAAHHATSGNLSQRSWSRDIYLMTTEEYRASSLWMRIVYRLYRNRLVLFFVLAPLVFLVEHRRYTADETSFKVRASVWTTNIALLGLATALYFAFEPARLLQVLIPFYALGAAVGVWLFYVQHQFGEAYWAPGESYSPAAASLMGSSVLRLSRPLAWLTGYIGIHHIHHLAPRVPSYALSACDAANPQLSIGPQFTLAEALVHARGDLWDPAGRRLLTFGEARS